MFEGEVVDLSGGFLWQFGVMGGWRVGVVGRGRIGLGRAVCLFFGLYEFSLFFGDELDFHYKRLSIIKEANKQPRNLFMADSFIPSNQY